MIINIIKRKKDILDNIYYIDDNGIEYWHTLSKEATIKEQEEMERILERFRAKEEDIK